MVLTIINAGKRGHEELEKTEIKIDGQKTQFTVGTGHLCDFKIPIDIFIESTQFMIYPDNNYFKIRDCALLRTNHTMIKVDQTPHQIHNGTVVSFADEVHYIFDVVVGKQAYPQLRA